MTDTPDGLQLPVHNPDFKAQMAVARELMNTRNLTSVAWVRSHAGQ